MARKIPVLGRVLGAPALYASVYGEIGSSLYYALGITAVYALGLTPIVFLIAGALFTLAAAAYAEGGATIDEPGGGAAFARRAFNDMVGFIAGWATILDYLIGIALAALFIPHYVAGAFGREGSVSAHQATALAVAIVLAITVVRLFRRARRVHRGRRRLAARPGRPGGHGRVRPGAPVRLARPHRRRRPRRQADLERAGVRHPDRDDRLHRPGEGRQPGRHGEEPGEGHPRQRPHVRVHRGADLRGDRDGGHVGLSDQARPRRPRALLERADHHLAGRADARPEPRDRHASAGPAGDRRAPGRRPDGDADPGAGDHHQLLGLRPAVRRDGRALAAAADPRPPRPARRAAPGRPGRHRRAGDRLPGGRAPCSARARRC